MSMVTCVAPVNIAVIKYWGKRDETLILPLNDSVSATLSTKQMRATTSVMRSPDFEEDKIWLNGKEESFENPRLKRCLLEIRKRAKYQCDRPENDWKVHVCSENNFPTAAGLASSAAGYACFVFTLAKLFKVEGDLSSIARQGSGSACRSLDGGFVRWCKGVQDDGSDSLAQQLFPAHHWPSLRIMILVVNDKKKKVSSTDGMQRAMETSELLQHRVNQCVPRRVQEITQAIAAKDFKSFAEITMRDSNQFHAIALDTFPPAVYMNDVSHAISDLVHNYNTACNETKVAYTFDAGPNVCLFMEEESLPRIAALVKHVLPPLSSKETEYFTGIPIQPTELSKELKNKFPSMEAGLLQFCILTEVGEGSSQLMEPHCHLLTEQGFPKHTE